MLIFLIAWEYPGFGAIPTDSKSAKFAKTAKEEAKKDKNIKGMKLVEEAMFGSELAPAKRNSRKANKNKNKLICFEENLRVVTFLIISIITEKANIAPKA